MGYTTKNSRILIGDTWHCSDGDKVHAFFLQFQKDGEADAGREAGGVGHAVSDDLIRWKTLPSAVLPGEKGSYNDSDIWTGCTVYENGRYYLYYTSRSSAGPDFSFSLATSDDGVNFVDCESNPLLVPDERYYYGEHNRIPFLVHGSFSLDDKQYDLRDLCIAEHNGVKYGFFAARALGCGCTETAAIGLCKTEDFVHFEQFPPAFQPKKYHVIETPDVFYLKGRWYMLCLSGNCYGQVRCTRDRIPFGRITFYGVSDRIEGPYTEPDDSALLVTMTDSGACAKTVLYNGTRYMFYTEVLAKENGEHLHFMSLPKVVDADENGRLYLGWYRGIEDYYEKEYPICRGNLSVNDGRWGNIGEWSFGSGKITGRMENDWCILPFDRELDNFVFETDIKNNGAASAGINFDLGNNIFDGGLAVVCDFADNTVFMSTARNFKTLDARSFEFESKEYRLKILVNGYTVEVYIDGKLIFHRLAERKCGRLALFVENGETEFSNTVVYPLKPINND